MLRLLSHNPDETKLLAKQIGQNLRGGEVIELVSDLGGGKTTFVKGLADGLGYKGLVNSPTFSLSHEYKAKGLTLYHFDFYRLNTPGLVERELAEVITDPRAVAVIEWPATIEAVLPAAKLEVKLKVAGESSREIVLSYPKELNYLIKDVNT